MNRYPIGHIGRLLGQSLTMRWLELRQLAAATRGVEGDWTRLLRNEVAPVLGLCQGDYTVSRRPPGLSDDAPFRLREHVRFVQAAHGQAYVVRMRRRWRLGAKEQLRQHGVASAARAGLLLQQLELPVPPLIWLREATTLCGLRSHFLSIEQFVPGRPLDLDNGDEVAAAMQLLARLHRQPGEMPGMPGKYRVERARFVRDMVHYTVLRALGDRRRTGPPPDRRLTAQIMAAARKAYLEQSLPLCLIHGDINAGNFLHGEDGGLRLLDFDSLRYDLPGSEILRAVYTLSGGNSGMASHAWCCYFDTAGETRWHHFLAGARFALLLHLLRRPGAPCPTEQLRAVADDEVGLWGRTPGETDWSHLIEL
ncbi:hypothetical protein B1C78_12860 [Thioalkalivibrio denitrificans]|uniref:Aminoglycoside phosphotransferase domain-containing protein n=1 Tax=Thioalkalivibrio denitrificans TaxID=108003 RepID=A0A1V3ND87_9GAMM|nr:aminoglycoside phosphotransferase family protein [Thioalkalivibrio denitrificans]OOG23011.1 hypothetical protein B1C78_12860 [Thioalkalivibrio denitrificans]